MKSLFYEKEEHPSTHSPWTNTRLFAVAKSLLLSEEVYPSAAQCAEEGGREGGGSEGGGGKTAAQASQSASSSDLEQLECIKKVARVLPMPASSNHWSAVKLVSMFGRLSMWFTSPKTRELFRSSVLSEFLWLQSVFLPLW